MSLTRKLEKKRAKEAAKKEAERMVFEADEELCRKMDGLWLYELNRRYHFGKEVLESIYFEMIELYIHIMRRYRCDDKDPDLQWFVIEQHLRENVGIDLKELQAEADRRYPHGAGAEARKENNNG